MQKTRIDIFLNPESDPKGAGYNVLQSKIAIGSGELTGMGLLNGNQTQLGYLSPKTTDFIYSVVGEEMGFIISAAVILVYVTLITKSLYVAKTASDDLGSYIAAGISGIFLFHMAENIGMTLGLLPITGVPLLFISYGGSSMITSYICIGLLLNISGNRKKDNIYKIKLEQLNVFAQIKIGNVELKKQYFISSMAGITDLPFRICEKFEPGLVCTEMVSSKAIFYGDEKTKS